MSTQPDRERRVQLFAVLFAVLMATAVLAVAGPAAVAGDGSQTVESPLEVGDLESNADIADEQLHSDAAAVDRGSTADVDDALLDPDDTELEVIVRFDEADTSVATSQAEVTDVLQAHAADTQVDFVDWTRETEAVTYQNSFWIANAVLVTVDLDVAAEEGIDVFDEMAAQPHVDRIHENFEVTIASGDAQPYDASPADVDPAEDTTYGLEMINATEVWDQHGTQGEGAAVAVLDTGVDTDHPDMEIDEDNWQEFDDAGNPIDTDPNDGHGHGTHVSGTVLGPDEPADDDIPAYGVAPGAELYHGKVLDDMGGGSFAQVAAGMEWAVEDTDADIISMSLGADGYWPEMIEPSENAHDAGIVLVSSIGNSGEGISGSPGNVYPNVASGAVDENENVAAFSGGEEIDTDTAWGDDAPDYWPDEYVVPDVAAPGVDVLSAHPDGGFMCGGVEYCEVSGTSMSAPHKAGVFALMVAASGGAADHETMIDAMEETAWKPDDWDEPDDEKDVRYGYGIIDALAATDMVALDSGIEGTVTDADGDPIEGASVTIEETGASVETDADGEYTLLAHPDEYTVTADAFGYGESSETVEVPDDETFVEQDFELDENVDAMVIQDQPEAIEGGDFFDVEFDVAHLETFSVERTNGYDGELLLELDGESIEEGEDVDVGDVTGEVTLTVQTELGTAGDLELEHTFMGPGEDVVLTTGPTEVFDEYVQVAVVDDGFYGDDVVDRLDAQLPESYEIDLLSGSEALDAAAADEYDVYVVQNINDAHVADLDMHTEDPTTGVVWLDQWGSGSDGIPSKSAELGNPASTDQSITSPNPDYEVLEDHPIFDGVGEPGDHIQLHTAFWADHSWFDDYDGEVVGHLQAGGVTDGGGVGVDEDKRTVLLASLGTSLFVDSADYTDDADAILANAVDWAAEDPPVQMIEDQPEWAAPEERFGSQFWVNNLEKVKTSLHEDSTADQDDLTLYHSGSVNAFDEWRAYDPPRSSDEFMVEIESDEDTVGSVVLETTFVFADNPDASGDGMEIASEDAVEITLTTGPTAVYEQPLEVPHDVATIQEAVDLGPDGAEIVVDEGTYEEVVDVHRANLTIVGQDGATIVAPEDGAGEIEDDVGVAAKPDLVDVTAEGVDISGFDVDGGEQFHAIHLGADGATVSDVSATDVGYAVWSSQSGDHAVSSVDAVDSDYGVYIVDSHDVDVTDVETTNTFAGAAVVGSTDVTVTDVESSMVDYGVKVDGSTGVAVSDVTVEDAEMAGVHADDSSLESIESVDAMDVGAGVTMEASNVGTITMVDVTNASEGIAIDGGSADAIVDNDLSDVDTGISATGGASVADLSDNDVTGATYGLVIAGSFTSVDATMNAIEADTGVMTEDVGVDDVSLAFNDLEMTETAIANDGDDPIDARHNWFGDRGPVANNGVEGTVVYDPFLTEAPETVDPDTTALAVDVVMEDGGIYTIGVPGTTEQTVEDVFGEEFEGTIYDYDAETGNWTHLTGDDELSSLSAMLVIAEDDGVAALDFQLEQATVVPGSEDLYKGWNLVSPSAYADVESAFGQTHSQDNLLMAHEHGENHLGETIEYLGEDFDGEADVNPFGGYWVHVESADDEYEFSVNLHDDPTTDEIYEGLELFAVEDDPEEPPEEPIDEVDVAVVDDTLETRQGEDLVDALEVTLDDDYTVDLVENVDLLDSMDDYDVFVIQRFDSDGLAADFLDALEDDQGVVYLDGHQGPSAEEYPDGVYRMHNVRDDPVSWDSESTTGTDSNPTEVTILEDHPIFDGVGDAGDTVILNEDTTTWGSWFDGYSGDVLADADYNAGEPGTAEGHAIGVDDAENEVLLNALAYDFFSDREDLTDEGELVLANAVEYAATLAFDAASEAGALEDGAASMSAAGAQQAGAIAG